MKARHWLMLIVSAAIGLTAGWFLQPGSSGSGDDPAGLEADLAAEQRELDGAAGNGASGGGRDAVDEGMLGKQRPGFVLPDLDGEPVDVARFDGDILIINFWATWCPPCVEEIPMLIDLQEDLADEGVRVFGVAVERAEPVREFAAEFGIQYPLVADRRDGFEVAAEYGNPHGLMPYTVFVDRDGIIRGVHQGLLSREQAEQHLSAMRTEE